MLVGGTDVALGMGVGVLVGTSVGEGGGGTGVLDGSGVFVGGMLVGWGVAVRVAVAGLLVGGRLVAVGAEPVGTALMAGVLVAGATTTTVSVGVGDT